MVLTLSDTDLLMIGKTGYGKSSLGNAILRRNVFESDCSYESVTTESNYEFADFKGRVIKVVDGPGVGDTRLSTPDDVKQVVSAMEQAMLANTRGYHACLIVVKFGERYTQEDIQTIKLLKNIFGGDEFVSRHCIVVMTCGDRFNSEMKRAGKPSGNAGFQAWCLKQGGAFKELLQEVGGRCVLFDNYTTDRSEQNAQIQHLLDVVDSLQTQGIRYTDRNFELAKAARERAVVESGKPEIREEVLQQTSLILQRLDEIRENVQDSEQIPLFEELLVRCDAIIGNIREQDKGTSALKDLDESVTGVRRSVDGALRVQVGVLEEKRVLKEREDRMKADMEAQMQQQRADFERLMAEQKKTEEDRRRMEAEIQREREEAEERRRQERDAREKELVAQLERERALLAEQSRKLQEAYNQSRKKSKGGWFGKALNFVSGSLPFMSTATAPVNAIASTLPSIASRPANAVKKITRKCRF